MSRPTVYLAGPDVFAADPLALGAEKKRICATHGFEGLYPLDNEIPKMMEARVAGAAVDPAATRRAIFAANIELVARADLCVANVTPFKGLDADAGTAFEIGMAHSLDKRIYLYSAFDDPVAARHARAHALAGGVEGADAEILHDVFRFDGFEVEGFDSGANLMLVEAALASGGAFLRSASRRIEDLALFDAVMARVAADLAQERGSQSRVR